MSLKAINISISVLVAFTLVVIETSATQDFSDYRDVNGLKLPFVIRTSDVAAFDTTIRRFNEIKIDPTVDDRIFDVP